MAFVVIRKNYGILKCAKICVGVKMGEVIAHFQCGVATLQWCCDTAVVSYSRGRGVHGRPACAYYKGLALMHARVCLRRPVAIGYLECSVATENSLSR